MNETKFPQLRNEQLDNVTGGENVVHGHVGFRFEPTTKAQPWTPVTGQRRRHHERR